ncbi:hypothetical protein [Sphingobium sp. CCH11-B1]|uniref:hypothetical protein n=1 Tax=Sphingobium sp. CCH11-B1 TaxID=1768781 RepID=UPI000B19EEFC|nr:hypothetical protein [Sphingobium sp. CCH11-B1]
MKQPLTQQQAMDEAVRKARRDKITAKERDMIVSQLRTLPLPEVHRNTRRSYLCLGKIAEANGL